MSTLKEELEKFKEFSRTKMSQEVQDVMAKAINQIKSDNVVANVLKVSDTAKDFNLPNAVNTNISLDELLKDNDFLVVNFYRGVWCPYCNLELKAFQNINEQLKALNAKLVAISPQTPDVSLTTKEKNELDFEVLSDNHNLVAKEYGLVFSLFEELRPIYDNFGINLPVSNGDDSFELPLPATFVINKNKEILYAFASEDHTQRSEPQTILDIISKNS